MAASIKTLIFLRSKFCPTLIWSLEQIDSNQITKDAFNKWYSAKNANGDVDEVNYKWVKYYTQLEVQ